MAGKAKRNSDMGENMAENKEISMMESVEMNMVENIESIREDEMKNEEQKSQGELPRLTLLRALKAGLPSDLLRLRRL